jgi:muramoyltetrapeptide carboxypeptidase
MDRRTFIIQSSLAGLSTTIPASKINTKNNELQPAIYPKPLRKGGTIGLVTPGSALSRSAFEKSITSLSELGFQVKYTSNLRVRADFLSGTDQQRVDDLHQMFEDDEVDAVFCARGGYGATRLLDLIDYDIIRNNPKPFLGYSDITALHAAFYKHTGLVCFHGPVGASEWNDFSADYVTDILTKGKKVKIRAENPTIISSGKASGKLIGGNLSLLTALIGTPHDVDYSDHLLFIEEVGESTYRVDRMLTQLLSSGKLKNVAGIALGYFTDCDADPSSPYYEYSIGLKEVLADRLGGLGVPVVYGFPIGHEPHNATLPIGVNAQIDAERGVIKLLESAVNG